MDIVYDPRNMDYIYILDDTRDFDKGFLLSHEDRFMGKTLEEIEYLLAYERMKYEKNHDKELQAKVDLISDIEAIVKEAEQQAVKIKYRISNTSRLRGISQNRSIEKMINRKSEYIELDRKVSSNEGKIVYINSEEDDDFADDYKLFKQIQKERFDE